MLSTHTISSFFFFNDTATTEIYTLSLHDALPIYREAAAWASRMEARYRGAKTLQATFLERYAENGREVRTESGTAYFRRPGKMRWEYEVPEKNLFLVDGKTAWFYVPGDHTATRVPAKEDRKSVV